MTSSFSKNRTTKNRTLAPGQPHWKTEESEPPKNIISQEYIENRSAGNYHKRGKRYAYERIQELKPLVDRIIEECKAESKEVRNGLQTIKEYQLDVLGELEDAGQNGARETYEIDPNDPEIVALKEQNLQLMTNLNNQIRAGNDLARNYKQLQSEYQRMRAEFERRQQQPQQYLPTQSSYFNQNSNRGAAHDDYYIEEPNKGGRRKNKQADVSIGQYDDRPVQPQRQYAQDRPERKRPTRHDDSPNQKQSIINRIIEEPRSMTQHPISYRNEQSEVARLREEVAQLKRKLAEANSEIDRLHSQIEDLHNKSPGNEELKGQLRRAQARAAELEEMLKINGDVLQEIAKLKAQNEELRVETVRLLKAKEPGVGSRDSQQEYERELARLQRVIEKENEDKKQFLDDISEYKRKFIQMENTIKSLKAENDHLKTDGSRSPNFGAFYKSNEPEFSARYAYGSGETYNNYDDIAALQKYSGDNRYTSDVPSGDKEYDDKLNKYKDFLANMKNNPIV